MVHKDNVPWPIDEATFLAWKWDGDVPPGLGTSTDRSHSLIAQMILLNQIFMEINDFHTSSTAGSSNTTTLDETVRTLSGKLDRWHSLLPSCMRDTPENLHRYGEQKLGRIFVAVHLGYYHFGQLLFYQYLQQDSQTSGSCTGSAHLYAEKCKAYASSLCALVYASHSTPRCKVLYTMVGHNLVVASTIQIHTLLFSDSENAIKEARGRLERNFQILLELRNFWPVLEISFEAFRKFRDACRRSMYTAFKMDDWMLRFLYGFANQVEDKEVYEIAAGGVWPVENIGFSPRDWMERN